MAKNSITQEKEDLIRYISVPLTVKALKEYARIAKQQKTEPEQVMAGVLEFQVQD